MDDKQKFEDNRGAGVDPIPVPDSGRLGHPAATDKVEDIVGGIMDGLEEGLTGDSVKNSEKDQSEQDNLKDK